MTSLTDAVKRAGYTVCYAPSFTAVEIEGEGNWERLERYCRHICRNSVHDCVDVVLRSPDGTRTDYSVGMAGTQVDALPPLHARHRAGQVSKSGYVGVKARMSQKWGLRWLAEVHSRGRYHYIGMFATAQEAAAEREKYMHIHHLKKAGLNFPKEESHG